MNRLARVLFVASTLSLGFSLANCSSFDPTSALDDLFASQKKPLQGERKALFPSGTPGVPRGVPPELVKGYQPSAAEPADDAQAVPEPGKKPKAKPKVAAGPASAQSTPTSQLPQCVLTTGDRCAPHTLQTPSIFPAHSA